MRALSPPAPDAVLPAQLAELLADHGEAALPVALDRLVAELGLRSATLHDLGPGPGPRGAGEPDISLGLLAGAAGHEPVRALRVVADLDASRATVELPVRSGGRAAAVLTAVGARPSQLPVLRAAAAVLGLALSRPPRQPTWDGAAALVAAADAEAAVAADMLHDGPVQALVVAHLATEAATRGGDPVAAREAVQAALVELRRSLWHLRPRGGDEGGLPGALGLLSARLVEAGRPPLALSLDAGLAAGLPTALVSAAYRLVQTVALPGAAGPVRVSLGRQQAAVVLDVEGGAPLADRHRWADKLTALGASLTVRPDGCRLVLSLPDGSTSSRPPSTPPSTKATP